MGKGIELARKIAPEHAQAMDEMKEQLLIVLINRLGGNVKIPVTEIDDTGGYILKFSINPETRIFTFISERKQ